MGRKFVASLEEKLIREKLQIKLPDFKKSKTIHEDFSFKDIGHKILTLQSQGFKKSFINL